MREADSTTPTRAHRHQLRDARSGLGRTAFRTGTGQCGSAAMGRDFQRGYGAARASDDSNS